MSSFSSRPDADADTIDDDDLLQAYLETSPSAGTQPTNVPDWPPSRPVSSVSIDPMTITWFKTHHQDWQAEIGRVLRGWITAQDKARHTGP